MNIQFTALKQQILPSGMGADIHTARVQTPRMSLVLGARVRDRDPLYRIRQLVHDKTTSLLIHLFQALIDPGWEREPQKNRLLNHVK